MPNFDFSSEGIDEKLKELKSKNASVSFLRILSFFGLIGFFILFLSENPLWGVPFAFVVWVFIRLINYYNRQKDQEAIYLSIKKMDSELVQRKARNLSEFSSGTEFLDKAHPFTNDLDLFGDHSLFQLLNETSSNRGRNLLAERLKSSFDSVKAEEWRQSVDELKENRSFLRSMISVGKAFYQQPKEIKWSDWLSREEKIKSWLWPAAIIGPLGGLVLLALIYASIIPASFLGLWILIGMIFLGVVFRPLKQAYENIPSRHELKTFRYWVNILEEQSFQSKLLQKSQSPFLASESKASEILRKLDGFGLWMQNRINLLYIPLNLLFWTDLWLYLSFEGWRKKNGKSLSNYPKALSEWEVWNSLGYFQSEIGFPGEFKDLKEGVEAKGINHPLLLPEKSIANNFEQNYSSQVILLTGANMSGKTTFMRTLGINMVLVNIGLRPFAEEFGFGPCQLYTSMRNTDNLGESVSSFYAELSRIKKLIDRSESGESMYFLLDEILKGTNTEDRIAGSEALIKQITNTKAMGIISTHDIELAELSKKEKSVKNHSFHSEVKDETIDFDYTLKEGPCPSFNAHKLMELMGIRFQN
ncbi:MutS-related protein [Algoriphagus sediminis]|uniref:DNA mismatch repair protein n=1 Tax=Algoriphagus sediminis TaxID=3057113 RepID=A0ABT7YB91_9BACT|nr:DNA mismatch repair protein [Algoriphagus sediminis]MDN3203795.1 DNA mismatch repair protein [Algoriphagus sediminis]